MGGRLIGGWREFHVLFDVPSYGEVWIPFITDAEETVAEFGGRAIEEARAWANARGALLAIQIRERVDGVPDPTYWPNSK